MYYYFTSDQDQYNGNLDQDNEDQGYDEQNYGEQGYDERMDMGMDMGRGMERDMGMYGDMGRGMEREREMGMYPRISVRDAKLVEEVTKAIIGEVQAYYYYDKLADLAPNDTEKDIIKSIQEDEAKHYHWFTSILHGMGVEVTQIPAGEMPTDFQAGVEKAFHDEVNANEFYLDIGYNTKDDYVEHQFHYAAHDENRHAAMLNNILIGML